MIRSIRLVLIILSSVAIFSGLFLLYATLIRFNPPKQQVILQNPSPNPLKVNVPLTALTWNIGYAGLGENMDFFYFGGKGVRDKKMQTQKNLEEITNTLKRADTVNFILLQNVDFNSTRSHYNNQLIEIENTVTAYQKNFAINYSVNLIPFPISSPYGRVFSGIVTMFNRAPSETYRISLPTSRIWPKSLFLPNTCMLVNRFSVENAKDLVLINIHLPQNSDAQLRKLEMDEIKSFIQLEFEKGNYVIVAGDWGQSPPDFDLAHYTKGIDNLDYNLTNIPPDFTPESWNWAYDSSHPTARYLNQPFIEGESVTSLHDYFLLSPNIELRGITTINENFKYSFHNPVLIQFILTE